MEPLAVVTLVFALLVVATRAPLILWPSATLDRYRAAIATPARVRLLGLLIGALGAAFVVTAAGAAEPHPTASQGLEVLGAFLIAGAAWLLAFPASYQLLAETVLDGVRDPTTLRVLGVLATAIGAALAWLAVQIA